MSNITIFEEQTGVATVRRESRRMDRMGGSSSSLRRIQLSNGRTFKRIVSGEQIGKAVPDQLDVIVVDWLNEPSRKFYATSYDKDAKATLPDCCRTMALTRKPVPRISKVPRALRVPRT